MTCVQTTYDLHTLRMVHFDKDYIVVFEDERGQIRDYMACKKLNTTKARDLVSSRVVKNRWRGDIVMYPIKTK